jgi:SPOR domain
MTTTDYATDVARPDLQSEDSQIDSAGQPLGGPSKPLKGLLFGFAATMTIGLALATWYVGLRIVAANEVAASSVFQSPSVGAIQATVSNSPAATSEDSMAEAFWYTMPPAELYLQVAGLGPEQDAGFVKSLAATGFRAQLQPRGNDDPRILIGPFSTHVEMEQAQRKLESTGILATEMSR